MAIDKPIYFNVFRNETPSQKAPTHSWNKWKNDKDIILPAGEYDLAFFGNATRLDPKTKEMVDKVRNAASLSKLIKRKKGK